MSRKAMRPFALEAALPTCRPGEDPTNSQRFGRELDQGPHGQVLLSESTASRGPMPRRSSRVRSNWTAWKEQIINAVKLTARRVQSFQACGVCHLAFGKSFLRVERSKLSSIGAVVCHEAFMIPARRTDPSELRRLWHASGQEDDEEEEEDGQEQSAPAEKRSLLGSKFGDTSAFRGRKARPTWSSLGLFVQPGEGACSISTWR